MKPSLRPRSIRLTTPLQQRPTKLHQPSYIQTSTPPSLTSSLSRPKQRSQKVLDFGGLGRLAPSPAPNTFRGVVPMSLISLVPLPHLILDGIPSQLDLCAPGDVIPRVFWKVGTARARARVTILITPLVYHWKSASRPLGRVIPPVYGIRTTPKLASRHCIC